MSNYSTEFKLKYISEWKPCYDVYCWFDEVDNNWEISAVDDDGKTIVAFDMKFKRFSNTLDEGLDELIDLIEAYKEAENVFKEMTDTF